MSEPLIQYCRDNGFQVGVMYVDAQTGVRLAVEDDIPEHPRITLFTPDGMTWADYSEMHAALQRLLHRAGLLPDQTEGPHVTDGYAVLYSAHDQSI